MHAFPVKLLSFSVGLSGTCATVLGVRLEEQNPIEWIKQQDPGAEARGHAGAGHAGGSSC